MRSYTFNMHQLLHLGQNVRNLGPLWSNSCFPFEDYNGDLRDFFHGTQNVEAQVSAENSCYYKLSLNWYSIEYISISVFILIVC